MEEGHSRNQKMGRDVPFLGENVSFVLYLVGNWSSCETAAPLQALRILKVIEPGQCEKEKAGLRVDASRNFWEGSGLKIDSSSTDVVWGHGRKSFD